MDIVDLLRRDVTTVRRPDGTLDFVSHAAADEIERLRDAIRFALEALDGDDDISAWEELRAALGEERPLEDRWDDA